MSLKIIHNYSLFLYVFLLHFEYWDILTGNIPYFSLSKLSAILYIVLYIFRFKRIIVFKEVVPYIRLLFGFYFLLLFVSFLNINSLTTVSNILNANILLNFFMFYFITSHIVKFPILINSTLKSFVFGGIVIGILIYFNIGITESEFNRIYMFGEDPNYVGYRLVFTLSVIFVLVGNHKLLNKPYRLLLVLAIPLLLSAVVSTGSRGAMICFLMLNFIFVFKVKTKWYFKFFIILFTIAIVLLMIDLIMQDEEAYARVLRTIEDGDTAKRTEIWSDLIPLYLKNPIIGIGETGYIFESYKIYGELQGSHNVYIELLIKTGVFGLIIYLGFLFKILNSSLMVLKKTKLILPLLFIIGVLFMFTNIQGLYNKTIYYLFAIIISMNINHGFFTIKR